MQRSIEQPLFPRWLDQSPLKIIIPREEEFNICTGHKLKFYLFLNKKVESKKFQISRRDFYRERISTKQSWVKTRIPQQVHFSISINIA